LFYELFPTFDIILTPNPEILKQIVTVKMPFGKFGGRLLCDLPIEYLEWFKRKGDFPKGKLGVQLDTVYEIKLNGLEDIIFELKKRYS
jgi:uncharacterized protein (DUF3820 family)